MMALPRVLHLPTIPAHILQMSAIPKLIWVPTILTVATMGALQATLLWQHDSKLKRTLALAVVLVLTLGNLQATMANRVSRSMVRKARMVRRVHNHKVSIVVPNQVGFSESCSAKASNRAVMVAIPNKVILSKVTLNRAILNKVTASLKVTVVIPSKDTLNRVTSKATVAVTAEAPTSSNLPERAEAWVLAVLRLWVLVVVFWVACFSWMQSMITATEVVAMAAMAVVTMVVVVVVMMAAAAVTSKSGSLAARFDLTSVGCFWRLGMVFHSLLS